MPAFDAQNLADLSGICLHLSIWAATVRSLPQPERTERLTAREWQIVELVALGRTNAAIGTEVWITENSVKQALKRMFRKLEVSSRAEMLAQLSDQRSTRSSDRFNHILHQRYLLSERVCLRQALPTPTRWRRFPPDLAVTRHYIEADENSLTIQ
nr:helix-turn-helix transcriptional regulator [Chamaesiphon sp. VAR_48_metabat_135_sub]